MNRYRWTELTSPPTNRPLLAATYLLRQPSHASPRAAQGRDYRMRTGSTALRSRCLNSRAIPFKMEALWELVRIIGGGGRACTECAAPWMRERAASKLYRNYSSSWEGSDLPLPPRAKDGRFNPRVRDRAQPSGSARPLGQHGAY